jgi:hypothetical protein
MDVSDASYYIQENNENKGSRMGHTKKYLKKKSFRAVFSLFVMYQVSNNSHLNSNFIFVSRNNFFNSNFKLKIIFRVQNEIKHFFGPKKKKRNLTRDDVNEFYVTRHGKIFL